MNDLDTLVNSARSAFAAAAPRPSWKTPRRVPGQVGRVTELMKGMAR
jgi:hypothetical protein